MTGRSRAAPGITVAIASITVAACLPAPATTQAQAASELWTVFMIGAAGVGLLVWGLITVALVRFRRRGRRVEAAAMPHKPDDAPRLEMAWTAGPILLVLFLFWMTLGALDRIDARGAASMSIDVDAFRWQWRIAYEGSGVVVTGTRDAAAEMVVPAGEPVHVRLTSEDVIHSFYVPAFLFKRDAIPGHPTEFDLTVVDPGTYRGQCAEFCGVYHDRMTLTVRAVPRASFDAWLAAGSGAASPMASGGEPEPAGSPGPLPSGSGATSGTP